MHPILLQFAGVAPFTGPETYQITSRDDGGSWSAQLLIPFNVSGLTTPGPGRGLQLSSKSKWPGRILFIGWHDTYGVNTLKITSVYNFLISSTARSVHCDDQFGHIIIIIINEYFADLYFKTSKFIYYTCVVLVHLI